MVGTALGAFAHPTSSEWVYRERPEHYRRDQRQRAVERNGMKSGSGLSRKLARVKVQAGFRR